MRGLDSALPPRSQTVLGIPTVDAGSLPHRQASKKQRTEPNKLQRLYGLSSDRNDPGHVNRKKSTRARPDADLSLPRPTGTNIQAGNDADRGTCASASPVNDGMLWRVPTFHKKKDGDYLSRKKSSKKRRKDDRKREAEIKAMSSFVPVRPSAEDWMAGRPMKKESKRAKTGFGIGLRSPEWEKHNRSSDISLPLPESIDSALSCDSDYISYRVSALDALAPRPTLRCTTHTRSGTCLPDVAGPFRRPSPQRPKLSMPIPEETLKAHKRVDDLADDLSASELRELMERDQRRRARKRQLDQEKLEQKMARRAEKQRAAEAEAQRHGRESPPNLERGVLGRDDADLGIGPASAVVTSSRVRDVGSSPTAQNAQADGSKTETAQDDVRPNPLAAFHRVDSVPMQSQEVYSEPKERPLPSLVNTESKSTLRKRLSRSKTPEELKTSKEHSEPRRKDSEDSNSKGPLSWTSIFRLGNRNKRNSGGPSSFSNMSRDSMQAAPNPAPPAKPVPRRLNSNMPKRTMSRFREDLPELPISPPASRIQSPEPEVSHPAPEMPLSVAGIAVLPSGFQARNDTPVSEERSVEVMRQTSSTFSHPDELGVSPEPQSISFASVDSEGSWFSGKISKKRASSSIMEHGPGLRLHRPTPEPDNDRVPEEDMDITDDEYLARLAPPNGDRPGWTRHSSGEGRPSSDWGEEPHWGSVREQQPTVVHSHTVGRMKSREGLLKSHAEEEDGSALEPVDSAHESGADDEIESGGEQSPRATSIDLDRAHARRISANSAQLLSINTPSSVDRKRASWSAAAKAS